MKNTVFIQESDSLDSVEYDIVTEYEGKSAVLARCWDYALAEHIRESVEKYMAEKYMTNAEDSSLVNFPNHILED